MRIGASLAGYACAVVAAAAWGSGRSCVPRFDVVNVAMVYLLAVVVVALRLTPLEREAPTAPVEPA